MWMGVLLLKDPHILFFTGINTQVNSTLYCRACYVSGGEADLFCVVCGSCRLQAAKELCHVFSCVTMCLSHVSYFVCRGPSTRLNESLSPSDIKHVKWSSLAQTGIFLASSLSSHFLTHKYTHKQASQVPHNSLMDSSSPILSSKQKWRTVLLPPPCCLCSCPLCFKTKLWRWM